MLTVHDTFYLVNVVDNDFIKGDMFAIFERLLGSPAAAAK